MNQKIRFAVFDTTDLLINQVTLSMNELLEENKYEADDKSTITFDNFEIYDRPSFLEYLAANWQIQLVGAIDFGTGNRQPYGGATLHSLNETNWYETILRNTATVTE